MPKYDYFCDANGRTVEVSHAMNARVVNWGELCSLAGLPPGETATGAPVRKMISGGYVVSGGLKKPSLPQSCPMAQACCGGGCDFD